MMPVVIVIVVIAVVGLFVYAVVAKRRHEKAMADLAIQRGWTALGNQSADLYHYLPQYLQGLGQNGYSFRSDFTRTVDSYDMAYQVNATNCQTVFFQYQYTEYFYEYDPRTNQRRESSETHTFVVISTALSITLPTILLLHHNLLSKPSTFGQHTGLQSLSLEGDFNKHFDTYMMPNDQDDALTLLTPDTMELVINAANGASMQIANHSLILSFENESLTPTIIELALDNMNKLVANILSKAQAKLQTENPATTPSQIPISSAPTPPGTTA